MVGDEEDEYSDDEEDDDEYSDDDPKVERFKREFLEMLRENQRKADRSSLVGKIIKGAAIVAGVAVVAALLSSDD